MLIGSTQVNFTTTDFIQDSSLQSCLSSSNFSPTFAVHFPQFSEKFFWNLNMCDILPFKLFRVLVFSLLVPCKVLSYSVPFVFTHPSHQFYQTTCNAWNSTQNHYYFCLLMLKLTFNICSVFKSQSVNFIWEGFPDSL